MLKIWSFTVGRSVFKEDWKPGIRHYWITSWKRQHTFCSNGRIDTGTEFEKTIGTSLKDFHFCSCSIQISCTSSMPSTRTDRFVDVSESYCKLLGVLHFVLDSMRWTPEVLLAHELSRNKRVHKYTNFIGGMQIPTGGPSMFMIDFTMGYCIKTNVYLFLIQIVTDLKKLFKFAVQISAVSVAHVRNHHFV